MATWTDTATIKAAVTSGKPGIGIGGFGEQVPDNLQYLKDIIDQIGLASDQAIHDDFTGDLIATRVYTAGLGPEEPYTWDLGGTAPTLSGNPDHYIVALHNGAGAYSAIAASQYKMRFDLSRDHTVVYEVRHKSAQSDINEYWTFGFQDASLGVGGSGCVTDRSDFLGFIQSTGVANKYRAQTDNGGGPTVVVDDYGDASVWNVLRIEVTFAGSTQQVEFFVNGTSVGTSTTNITALRLRPFFGCYSAGGVSRTQYADYIDAFWTVRPLST